MRIGIMCFTEQGSRLCVGLVQELNRRNHQCRGFIKSKFVKADSEEMNSDLKIAQLNQVCLEKIESSLDSWTAEMFQDMNSIIFIGACGIAVRAIAPYIVHKGEDPAVLVIDERGNFVISLLSGHIGGANNLTKLVSEIIGATPVITTSTDINRRFAVDYFAKKEQLYMENFRLAKEVSAKIVNGGRVELYSDFSVDAIRYKEIVFHGDKEKINKDSFGIYITYKDVAADFPRVLTLVPKVITIGIGCKKGVPFEIIEERILGILKECQISLNAVSTLASIDLKAEEAGILAFARKYNVEFVTYTAEQLIAVNGEFSHSAFVEKTTGVDNVCERAATLASGFGKLVFPKLGKDGVTTAVAMKDWSVKIE